jgi:hypothetical protein
LEEVAPVRVAESVEGTFDLSGYDTGVDAVIAVLNRHPALQGEL